MGVLERFYSKLQDQSSGCIVFTGYTDKRGYGQFCTGPNKTLTYAHVFAFCLHYKREPRLKDLHHKCENPSCCNPEHLEERDRSSHMLEHVPQFCPRGHEYAVVGQTKKSGNCNECHRIAARKQWRVY